MRFEIPPGADADTCDICGRPTRKGVQSGPLGRPPTHRICVRCASSLLEALVRALGGWCDYRSRARPGRAA